MDVLYNHLLKQFVIPPFWHNLKVLKECALINEYS